VQKFISDYYDVSPSDIETSYFGRITQGWVIKFQKAHGLPAFGIVGSLTRAVITKECGGASITATHSITLPASPTTGTAPLTVTFTGVGKDIQYGDGSFGIGPSGSVDHNIGKAIHTYTSVGTYTARSDGSSVVITVGEASHAAGFNADLTGNPLEVNYIYTGGTTYFGGLRVDFGDGQSGAMSSAVCASDGGPCRVASVAHKFASPGTYTATLVGIGEGNNTTVDTLSITVGIPVDIVKRVGEQEGSFLIQTINSTSVDGLWYQAYPVATNQGTPKTLHIGDDIGYACAGVSEKLRVINSGAQTVTFSKVTGAAPLGGCPI
jgi:PKD repeat protein